MRIVLDFNMDNEYMPLDYHKMFISFIKHSLTEFEEGRFFDDYYNQNTRLNNKKNYSWAIKMKNPEFKKDHIKVIGKKLIMTFVSGEKINDFIFFSAFSNQLNKKFKISEENSISLQSCRIKTERTITGNMISFKILSPIILRIHNEEKNTDRYLSCEDEDFTIELKNKLKKSYPSLEDEIDNMLIDKSRVKKVVVKLFKQNLNATIGDLFIMADANLLKKMYEDSIGDRRPAGFGVLSVNDSWELVK